ncbi:fibrinogen-like protein 1 isoform X2 [Macrobrachium nipponense]|uniref:fibrinogen-like protein 1 isoform X2 n=1 Tax=Macrobrachium nipponense TaxID=159736 RepID=UPI0030C85AB7
MAACARAATVSIFLFLTKVTLATPATTPAPRLTENDCAVHTLPIEVLQQLMNSAEVILKNSDSGTAAQPGTGSSDAALDGSATHILLRRMDSELTELRRKVLSLEAGNSPTTSHQQEINSSIVNQLQQLQEETRQVKDQLSAQVQQLQEEVKNQLSDQVQQLQDETKEVKNQLLGLSQQVTQALQVPVATSGRGLETQSGHDTRPQDCYDLLRSGRNESGIYTIYPQTCGLPGEGVAVWCDMGEKEVDEGGWTVVLLRRPLSTQVNFNRGWRDYRIGFGSPDTEYWIGNDVLHAVTNGATQVLRVDMTDWDGQSRYQEYSSFHVADRDHEYSLRLGTGSGTAGDALKRHDNMLFSTPDRDNDIDSSRNCAVTYSSGFWFNKCLYVSPTNPLLSKQKNAKGIIWNTFHSDLTTLQRVTFKVKPAMCYSG